MQFIESYGNQLHVWNKHSFGCVHQKMQQARIEINLVHKRDPLFIDREANSITRLNLQEWLERDKLMLKK